MTMTAFIEEHNSRYSTSSNPSFVEKIKGGPLTVALVEATSSFDRYKVSSVIGKNFPQLAQSSIQVVKNDFLETMYLLKKAELEVLYGAVQEQLLVHVTGGDNVESIVRDNFDWRRVRRGMFGIGTSFSGDAFYANRYANRKIGTNRAFIISRVLVSKVVEGYFDQRVPTPGYDTTVGNNNKVIVKFSDHEVLPKYVIYYKCGNSYSKSFSKLSCKIPHKSLSEPKYYSESDQSDSSEDSVRRLEYFGSVEYTRSLNGAENTLVSDELEESDGTDEYHAHTMENFVSVEYTFRFNDAADKTARDELEDSDATEEYNTACEGSELSSNSFMSDENFESEGDESYYSLNSEKCLEKDNSNDQEYSNKSEHDPDGNEYSSVFEEYSEDDELYDEEYSINNEECSEDEHLDAQKYSGEGIIIINKDFLNVFGENNDNY